MKYIWLTLLLTGCATIDVTPQPLVPKKPMTNEERCQKQAFLQCEYSQDRDSWCEQDAYKSCMEKK